MEKKEKGRWGRRWRGERGVERGKKGKERNNMRNDNEKRERDSIEGEQVSDNKRVGVCSVGRPSVWI